MINTDSESASRPYLVLIRHGQASLGQSDYDRLSATGQRQGRCLAERLAEVLADDHAGWSGTLNRHRQTMAALNPDPGGREDAALNEFQTFALIRAAVSQSGRLGLQRPSDREFADPRTNLQTLLDWFPAVLAAWQEGRIAGDGLEDWSAFRQRVLSPVAHWRHRLAAGQCVVVVTSAGVISTLVSELAGYDLDFQRDLAVRLYNASVSELWLEGDRWRTGAVNCIDHLDRPELRTLA